MQDIPQYTTFSQILAIDRGWSSDKKYYVQAHDGQKMLLRLADISQYQRKKVEFEMLGVVSRLNINTPQPLDFGICDDGQSVYSLLSWLDGEDAEGRLPQLPPLEQYELGLAAGKLLQLIHTIPAPLEQIAWAERYNRKIDRILVNFRQCGITIPQEAKIIEYIENSRHLLQGRGQVLQHGDFHAGNLVVTADREIGIIDFNRCDYGDPWEEFNRIIWSLRISTSFAVGQIQGYFEKEPPVKFFKLLALYLAVTALASIPWALAFGQKEVDISLENIEEILDFYQGFSQVIPTWYTVCDYFN